MANPFSPYKNPTADAKRTQMAVSGATVYVGYAPLGTSTGATGWSIQQLTFTDATLSTFISETWAVDSGADTVKRNCVWANYLTLNYASLV